MKRLALPIVFLLVACSKPQVDNAIAVARIDGQEMTRAELDTYLAINLALEEDGGELDDVVCSRLLDSWIDERLILAEAHERMLTLNDETLDDLLDDPAYESGDGDRESRRAQLRNRLMIQMLQGQVLEDVAVPSAAEAAEWMAAYDPEAEDGRKVELRSLRFDDSEQAQKVHRDLRRNRLTFNEAVVQNSDDDSQGVPTVMEWTALPPEVQKAIEKLRPGWSSVPVEVAGSTYLFLIVAWTQSDRDSRLEAARTERYNAARREAWEQFVRQLRQASNVGIVHKNLPFSYVPDAPD